MIQGPIWGLLSNGVRNSEMSITSGPCSDSENLEAPQNTFAQRPPPPLPMHRLALANRHSFRRGNKKCAVGMKMNVGSVFLWAWGRSVEQLRVKSAIMTSNVTHAHDYERRHSKRLAILPHAAV